ncbi:MAG: DUF4923 family protein, partial [Bacteroidaceae bacterium]|nr:DUF4923 family protein [Bacteroidaceae bacterium]
MKYLKLLAFGLVIVVSMSCGSLGAVGGSNSGSSNGTGGLGGIFDILSNPNSIGNVISSVIGTNKITPEQLLGKWNYAGPGVAFTSDKA